MLAKIDIHNHILPCSWPDFEKKFGYGGFLTVKYDDDGNFAGGSPSERSKTANLYKNGQFFRKIEKNCWDLQERLLYMDRYGIDVQALSTVPVMFNYWAKPADNLVIARFLNDDLASSVAKCAKRFVGLGTLPMQDPLLAVEEMKRSVLDHNFPGFEIGTHVNEWNLDNKNLEPVFKTAQELDVCLFVHPWDMETGGRMSDFWLPWLVGMPFETTVAICCVLMGGVLLKFPRLKLCFAHGAGCFSSLRGRLNHGYRVRPDLCARRCNEPPDHFEQSIFADSLVHDEVSLQTLVATLGEDKVVLGTDYPFPLGEHEPGQLIERAQFLNKDTKKMLLYDNCAKLLKLDDKATFMNGF